MRDILERQLSEHGSKVADQDLRYRCACRGHESAGFSLIVRVAMLKRLSCILFVAILLSGSGCYVARPNGAVFLGHRMDW
ncbi:uncharacterized protein K460DRAFT_52082 [Cucurbitaria berberidis CBS 394.84]|uniref:Uncharacterized protein n=1 Tax=Cucurbitaria berberidis CBS 394.84 TaxID=1168544 RepID=A0A9P4GKR1_9PLEO|nr:uncharacterized protein K460DRAFT_52082 [Cucurbitaria berberidis CBS 394.84]KAF1847032.1 hypothetical protein K460DRAFT_52082 [Cucurbitaria berberidis CBS 394.84]